MLRIALALTAIVLLSSCGGKESPAPANWQPIPGARDAWSHGAGSLAQEYRYQSTAFEGGLQDLASQVTIDALTRNRGAKLQGSNPFADCPGAAGVATFRIAGGKTLQEGFAVRQGQAVRVAYTRPAGTPIDPNVVQAMRSVLCVPPA